MQYRSIIAGSLMAGIAFAQETGKLGDAEAILDNPVGVTYQAVLNSESVTGVVVATSKTGAGVDFDVSFVINPAEGKTGAYGYHIHDAPVPESGDCAETLAHLDPYQRGGDIPCDAAHPATCEVGDLAGKHGKAGEVNSTDTTTFNASYNDLYASTKEGLGQFFGNRSIVVHSSDKSRIACANFELVPTYGDAPTYGDDEPSAPISVPAYTPDVPVYQPTESAVNPEQPSSTEAPVVSSTPCATFLITKTSAETIPGDYGAPATTIEHTSVETSISYTAVVPETPTSVPEVPEVPEVPVYTPETPVENPEVPTEYSPETPDVDYPDVPMYTPETPVEVPAIPTYVAPPAPVAPYPTGAPSGAPVPPVNNSTVPVVPVNPPAPEPVEPTKTPAPAPPVNDDYEGAASSFGVSASIAAIAAFAGLLAVW